MNAARAERIGQQMREELGRMLQTEVKDPRIGFVSVTRVEVSRDLGMARVYVSVLGPSETTATTIDGLTSARSFLRGEVGRRLGLRHAPFLDFRLDASIQESLKIQDLMRSLHSSEEPGER